MRRVWMYVDVRMCVPFLLVKRVLNGQRPQADPWNEDDEVA